MSFEYDNYLLQHRECVKKGFEWMKENIYDFFTEEVWDYAEINIVHMHDQSKFDNVEYNAYDNYFYGNNHSNEAYHDFNRAWLHHIHNNPHHWQYWVLINDEPEEGIKPLPMSPEYVIEMICDWWSFSWNKENLFEIFDWYLSHKDYMLLHPYTRKIVVDILYMMKAILEKGEENNGSEKTPIQY